MGNATVLDPAVGPASDKGNSSRLRSFDIQVGFPRDISGSCGADSLSIAFRSSSAIACLPGGATVSIVAIERLAQR